MVTIDQGERPVFLLGPPRSGTSVLAWSLGQHARFRVLLPGEWVGRLSLDIEAALQRGAFRGRTLSPGSGNALENRFFRRFGSVAAELMASSRRCNGNDPERFALPPTRQPARWVNAAADNAFYVEGLLNLFPEARFIHVLREVGPVVHSLVSLPAADGAYYTEESACETWVRTVKAALDAERAFGSEVVHRLHFSDLIESPEKVLRGCLEFLEEPFEPACIRPLRRGAEELKFLPPPATDVASFSAIRADAERLSRDLLAKPPPYFRPDPQLRPQIAEAFRRRAAREFGESRDRSPVHRVRQVIHCSVPPEATVVVVSRGDDALLELDGRVGWHFPQVENGLYAGYYPASSAEAIEHLEDLRARGGDFLVFPCTAFWWFEHYPEFRQHLEGRYRIVAYQEDACVVFALRQSVSTVSLRITLSHMNHD